MPLNLPRGYPYRPGRLLAGLLAVLLARSTASSPAQGAEPGIRWDSLNDAALARAQKENRPIYVLIGSALSELSRATDENLANPQTAAYFDSHFVCVRLDRDDRPDLAAAAQAYLRTVKQMPGWPANLFLTPEGRPYDGANYLPAAEEWGKKSLLEIATAAAQRWKMNPTAARRNAAEAIRALADADTAAAPDRSALEASLTANAQRWRAAGDPAHAGFGDPPRYPEPELLRAMIRLGGEDRATALVFLRALAATALRDPLDGGFFRYLQDADGRLPYPQKLLVDQARLAFAYLDAERASPDPAYVEAARGALDYALNRLRRPDGLFLAAEDGTRKGAEAYFTWTAAEIDERLGAEAAKTFDAAYGATAAGNIPAEADPSGLYAGKNLLHRVAPPGPPSQEAELARDRARMLAARDRRPALAQDARTGAEAHGLMLAALARAGSELREGRYAAEARRLAELIRRHFLAAPNSVLPGSDARPGSGPAAPADYAALALGFRQLADTQADRTAAPTAARLLATCNREYFDAKTGDYDAGLAPAAAGVFVRAPAFLLADNQPSAETLAICAAPDSPASAALARGLAQRMADADPLAPGEILLGLSVWLGR